MARIAQKFAQCFMTLAQGSYAYPRVILNGGLVVCSEGVLVALKTSNFFGNLINKH